MSRSIPSLVLAVICLSALAGCSKERTPTFEGQPQAENQRKKTDSEVIDHYVVMLNLEDSEKKNLKGATRLGEYGTESAAKLPDLEEAAKNHPFESVREAAKKSIEQIKAAQSAQAAPAEGE